MNRGLFTERGKDRPSIVKQNEEIKSDIPFKYSQIDYLNLVLILRGSGSCAGFNRSCRSVSNSFAISCILLVVSR